MQLDDDDDNEEEEYNKFVQATYQTNVGYDLIRG